MNLQFDEIQSIITKAERKPVKLKMKEVLDKVVSKEKVVKQKQRKKKGKKK